VRADICMHKDERENMRVETGRERERERERRERERERVILIIFTHLTPYWGYMLSSKSFLLAQKHTYISYSTCIFIRGTLDLHPPFFPLCTLFVRALRA
jgi:hypothetical protein